jgi:hypothetical protein
MATKKISALTELTTPAGTEELIVNAGGTSKKIQIDNLPSSLADNSVTLAKMAGGTDGNFITYDASGDPAYVTTGTSGQVLTSGGTGVAPTFQTAAGGGKVLQVVSTTASSETATTSTSYATVMSRAITPATGSKILVMYSGTAYLDVDLPSATVQKYVTSCFRDATDLGTNSSDGLSFITWKAVNRSNGGTIGFSYIDASPGGDGSTAITYYIKHKISNTSYLSQTSNSDRTITLIEIGA